MDTHTQHTTHVLSNVEMHFGPIFFGSNEIDLSLRPLALCVHEKKTTYADVDGFLDDFYKLPFIVCRVALCFMLELCDLACRS